MENVIANLVKRFERGSLTRRELVQSLAILVAAPRSASADGFQCSGVDHVSIGVSNLQRSAAFYQKTFGLAVLKESDYETDTRAGKTRHSLELREVRPQFGRSLGEVQWFL